MTLLGSISNAGADVTVGELDATAAQAITDANGSYFLNNLAAGAFTVTFSAAGYESQTRTGTVAAGDSAQISVSLEHSRFIAALPKLPSSGEFLGYAQWTPLADGGRAPGNQLFYLDPSMLISLQCPGGGAAGARVLLAADGGLRFLGFDREGGAVVERSGSAGAEADFADQGTVSALWLGSDATAVTSMGDEVYFATPDLSPESGGGSGQGSSMLSDWSAMASGDLGPTPMAQRVGTSFSPVGLDGAMAGWVIGSNGYDTPVIFGPEVSDPIDSVCAQTMTPLTASQDGQRLAFAFVPKRPPPISVTPPPPSPDSCVESSTPIVFVASRSRTQSVVQIADVTLANARAAVYPLTDTSYAGTSVDGNGLHLFVHAAAKSDAGWTSEWQSDITGWAPLGGPNLLAADRVDGGLALEAIGPAAIAGTLSASASIPFAHEWSVPLAVSADNRYVVLAGIGALFDLEKQIEIPLVLTPVAVQFDRLEKTALFLDRAGQMALLPLGAAPGQGPQGLRLEGSAVAASFTPDETEVAYAGTDAFGNIGLFVEQLPMP